MSDLISQDFAKTTMSNVIQELNFTSSENEKFRNNFCGN